ncbi:MAG: hypothetical protein EKK53_00845 [Burkholderiales bacterium]|nr:MAG: hypothetical protein EKK53_00845 [Burkholderiales bacterium]
MSENESLRIEPVHALSRVALGLALATTILSIVAVFAVGAKGIEPVATLCIGSAFLVVIVSIYSIDKRVRTAQRGAQLRPDTSHDHLLPSQREH